MGSVYLKDGIGMRGENLSTLDLMEGWIRKVQGLWLIGGDWNMPPEKLAPWVARMGAAVVAPSEPTCLASSKGTTIDCFVVSARLAPFVSGVEVKYNGAIKTHRMVDLRISAEVRQATIIEQVKPEPFPIEEPIGCRRAPPSWPEYKAGGDLAEKVQL